MAVYRYEAVIKDTTSRVRGRIHASSVAEARHILHKHGLIPRSVRLDILSTIYPREIPLNDMITMCDAFAELIPAGKSVTDAIKFVKELVKSKDVKERLELVNAYISKRGADLPAAFRLAGFPDFFVGQIQVASQSGKFAVVFSKLADWYRWQRELKGKFMKSMAYPVGIVVVTFLVVFYIIYFVMPKMQTLLSSLENPPAMLVAMYGLSMWLHRNLGFFAMGVIALLIAGFIFRKHIRAFIKKYLFDWTPNKYTLKVPWFLAYYLIDLSAIFRAFGMCIVSGLDMTRALEVAATVTNNPKVGQAMLKVRDGIKRGENFASLMGQVVPFPIVKAYLEIGEETGDLEGTTEKIADYLFKRVDTAINVVATVVQMLALIVVGIVIGGFIVKLFMAVYSGATSMKL